jgi:hypothetical protein
MGTNFLDRRPPIEVKHSSMPLEIQSGFKMIGAKEMPVEWRRRAHPKRLE